MSIFLSLTVGLTSAYVYDRRECKRIQNEYLDKVRWMSQEKLDTNEMARRVRVLAARVPEDGEVDRASRWFKRYIRVRLTYMSVIGSEKADRWSGSLIWWHLAPTTLSLRRQLPAGWAAH